MENMGSLTLSNMDHSRLQRLGKIIHFSWRTLMVKLYNCLSMGSTSNIISSSESHTTCHYKYQSEFIVHFL